MASPHGTPLTPTQGDDALPGAAGAPSHMQPTGPAPSAPPPSMARGSTTPGGEPDGATPGGEPDGSARGVLSAPAVVSMAAGELVGPPRTRSGNTILMTTPQRLPYRQAELAGEQRQLEEAIAVARRRIDEAEDGADSGSLENRVRLGVLRQDLSQKQERLQEILFLQDGYRWLQQQMAPDRALPTATTAAGTATLTPDPSPDHGASLTPDPSPGRGRGE